MLNISRGSALWIEIMQEICFLLFNLPRVSMLSILNFLDLRLVSQKSNCVHFVYFITFVAEFVFAGNKFTNNRMFIFIGYAGHVGKKMNWLNNKMWFVFGIEGKLVGDLLGKGTDLLLRLCEKISLWL